MKFKFRDSGNDVPNSLAADVDKLIEIQTQQLRNTYNVECLDIQQLQKVLNIGESNSYKWMKNCPYVRTIGRRKVIPIIWIARYLVTGSL